MNRFERYSKRLVWMTSFLLTGLVAGCGGGSDDNSNASGNPGAGGPGGAGGTGTTIVAPVVTATTPRDAALGVSSNTKITATFSKPMAAALINATTFTVTGPGTTAVAGTVDFDAASNIAIFTPAHNLAIDTTFTAVLTTAIKDTGGVALAANYVWSFSTGAVLDTTAPTINSTIPANAAIGVATNANVTATFNEAMDPATITATTVTVSQGTTPIAGAVTYLGTTATFNPTSDLAANTTFTATVTTGTKDLAGNALASSVVWSFTTAAAPAMGPAPVVLGTAGNYVILAKSKVSTTGTTAVVGNIGISPAAETYLTGFSEALDSTNVFATSSLVTGSLFAADMALPTPSNLTTAIGNMETAYTDAAGRSLPDFTELGAGDISGKTLVPGLYKWGTSVMLASGVTLSGGANDVWIFQIAQDLVVGNGVIVTLSGGAQAKNIFWQVAGQATLGTTSNFKGIILSKTQIVLQTGAKLNGRALAQTAVTLDANAVTQPAL